jgi:hypothetical protein
MDWSNIINQIISVVSPGNTPTPVNAPVEPSFEGTQLDLARDTFTEFSTAGQLSINGSWECFTIECPKESYEGSHVCIPCGTYLVELVDSPKHGPNTPQLKDVPGRTYIQMHSSNYAIDPVSKKVYLLGCIAPGTQKDSNVVYNSKIAMAAIMQKVDWTKPVRITISES